MERQLQEATAEGPRGWSWGGISSTPHTAGSRVGNGEEQPEQAVVQLAPHQELQMMWLRSALRAAQPCKGSRAELRCLSRASARQGDRGSLCHSLSGLLAWLIHPGYHDLQS